MPAKKKASANRKTAKSHPSKKAATKKPAAKRPVIKKEPVKKEAPRERIAEREEAPKPVAVGPQIDCQHCDGTGKCAAGEPYDKGHHQTFGSQIRLTSCVDCLTAAGEHSNSKKLVNCRICGGTGRVPAQ